MITELDLFYDQRNINLIFEGGIYNASLFLEERIDNKCFLKLSFYKRNICVEWRDFFNCISEIKNFHPNIIMLCKGYKYNVYPSRMTRQMGLGLKAYEMKLGKQATFEDLVDIFDYEIDGLSSKVEDQEIFYKKWLSSLR